MTETSPMPASLVFADADPALLAREDVTFQAGLLAESAWQAYLRRMLPPVTADERGRAGSLTALASPGGMADFLLGQGKRAARDMTGAMAGQGAFWTRVRREVERLS